MTHLNRERREVSGWLSRVALSFEQEEIYIYLQSRGTSVGTARASAVERSEWQSEKNERTNEREKREREEKKKREKTAAADSLLQCA